MHHGIAFLFLMIMIVGPLAVGSIVMIVLGSIRQKKLKESHTKGISLLLIFGIVLFILDILYVVIIACDFNFPSLVT